VSRLYLDTCCIIYLIEASSPFHGVVAARLRLHSADPTATLVTSRLSRLECRTKPLRMNDTSLLADYERFFAARRLVVAELSAVVVERATELRARYGFKTPDALHLATAVVERASTFLTGDGALARCSELRVEVVT
jgi:predicted nucleic acid-binding protein